MSSDPAKAVIILAINAGSSSVKVSVYRGPLKQHLDPTQIAEVQVSGLTAPPALFKYVRHGEKVASEKKIHEKVEGQRGAFSYILKTLENDEGLPELKHKDDIAYTCHRVVHGGDFERATQITGSTYHRIEELSDLAPLHNAGALEIVRAVSEELPKAKNIACFDSVYHHTIPKQVYTYAIDPELAEKNRLRKYGFHGLSYAFIVKAVAKHLGKNVEETNLIALHLGSGASMCAIKNGKSLDTTMGLTPLSGLPGATRSGDIDPSLVFHYTHDAGKPSRSAAKGMHITQAEEILNKSSGWQAMTGTTDFGSILDRMGKGDEKCKLAFDVMLDRILGFLGSYYVKLGGQVDALVFAGGIGEKGVLLRKQVVEGGECLGFAVDDNKNEEAAQTDAAVADITGSSSKSKVLVAQTDEQLEMARVVLEDYYEHHDGE